MFTVGVCASTKFLANYDEVQEYLHGLRRVLSGMHAGPSPGTVK